MDSDSDIISISTEINTFSESVSQPDSSINLNSDKFKNSKYNRTSFQFKSNETEGVYIFKNELFTRTLLPIDYSKEREMELQCTI